MKTSIRRTVAAAVAGVLLLGGLSACSYQNPDSDEVGLYYEEGSWDGQNFLECIDPGVSANTGGMFEEEDQVYGVPRSLRTWNIAPKDGDSNVPITVAAAPETGQPSGVQVNLWVQFAFTINSSCEGGAASPAVQWWEKVGQRYYRDDHTEGKTEWWGKMLNATIVSVAEAQARLKARAYGADPIVSGQVNVDLQKAISTDMPKELERMVGGSYFCKPTFDPNKKDDDCGSVEVLLKDADYTNPSIQAERDKKQAAVETAAAAVIEAQGKVDAAAKTGELYNNPAWVELEKLNKQLEMVKACAANPNCTLVLGADGVIASK